MGGPGSGRRNYGGAKNGKQATALKRVAIKRMIRRAGGKVISNSASTQFLRMQRNRLYK
jgi:hypothetical protein